MREVLENGGALSEKRHEYLASRMPDIAQQSSERERVAVEAERDTEQLKKAEFMQDKVGEEFEAMISSVTSFGMFIELDNTVEGLIRLSALTDDYYHFDEAHMALIGERTSKVFRIGDEVKIRVAKVNMDDHTIDFELVDMKPRAAEITGPTVDGATKAAVRALEASASRSPVRLEAARGVAVKASPAVLLPEARTAPARRRAARVQGAASALPVRARAVRPMASAAL